MAANPNLFSFHVASRAPDFIVHGAETTDPGSAAVLATVGPFPSSNRGTVAVAVQIAGDDSVPTYEVVHRNSANAADVDVAYIQAGSMPGGWTGMFRIPAGDYLVVRTKGAGTSAKIYAAEIFAWYL